MKIVLLMLLLATLPPLAAQTQAAPPTEPQDTEKAAAALEAKLSKIIIPQFSLHEMPLDATMKLLNARVKENDPAKAGVTIRLAPQAMKYAAETRLTLDLAKVPADELLKYITNLADVRFKYTASEVVIDLPKE